MRESKEKATILISGMLVALAFCWMLLITEPLISGQTYNNTSLVNTTVNITNAAPFVWDVSIPTPINLVAYSTVSVQCNATIYDYDNNTDRVNATLHQSTVPTLGEQDQNFRYWNTSCSPVTPLDYYTNFTCTFSVSYFANNGTWYCNVTGVDTENAISTNVSNPTIINPLIAIRTDSLIDYGQLAVNEISNDTTANVTNAGNRDINISVQGYAQNPGDGNAMNCTNGYIPLSYERYNITNTTIAAYPFMTQLTGTDTMIPNFYIRQRTDEALDSYNTTYWKISIPLGAGGLCTGKVLFAARDRGI